MYFLQRMGGPGWRCQNIWCLVRAYFLVHGGLSSCYNITWLKRPGRSVGTNPIREGAQLSPQQVVREWSQSESFHALAVWSYHLAQMWAEVGAEVVGLGSCQHLNTKSGVWLSSTAALSPGLPSCTWAMGCGLMPRTRVVLPSDFEHTCCLAYLSRALRSGWVPLYLCAFLNLGVAHYSPGPHLLDPS